jgi:TonB family protein
VLNIYETEPAPRSSASLAGSAAIHLVVLLIVLQVRAPLESRLPRYTATQLYVPAVESVAVAPKFRKAPAPPLIAPRTSHPVVTLRTPTPAPDLPAPPELSVIRAAPLPAVRPLPPSPVPPPPAPPPPVFASTLPAVPTAAHATAPRTGVFAAVPVTAASPAAKPQIAGGTFGTVPAGGPRHNSPTAATLPAGFGGVAAAPASQEPAPKPATTGTAFTAAVAADPRQSATHRQPTAEPLEILFKPRPTYTEEARRAHIEGDVVLEVLFTATGNLRVLRVVRGLGYGLEQNALDAAAKIRFRPASQDGHAVDTVAIVRISFQVAY